MYVEVSILPAKPVKPTIPQKFRQFGSVYFWSVDCGLNFDVFQCMKYDTICENLKPNRSKFYYHLENIKNTFII